MKLKDELTLAENLELREKITDLDDSYKIQFLKSDIEYITKVLNNGINAHTLNQHYATDIIWTLSFGKYFNMNTNLIKFNSRGFGGRGNNVDKFGGRDGATKVITLREFLVNVLRNMKKELNKLMLKDKMTIKNV